MCCDILGAQLSARALDGGSAGRFILGTGGSDTFQSFLTVGVLCFLPLIPAGLAWWNIRHLSKVAAWISIFLTALCMIIGNAFIGCLATLVGIAGLVFTIYDLCPLKA